MKFPRENIISALLPLVVVGLLGGCVVGPDFKKPAPPVVQNYTETPLGMVSTNPSAGDQRFVSGQDISAEWWKLFHSPALNDLIDRSLKANPNLQAAQAALAVARENVLAQKGAYYPSVSAGFSASRQKTSSQISPTPNNGDLYYNLFTPSVSVSYTPDVFGLNRRTVESLNTQVAQARFALIATRITLTANVAAAAIQEASLREQIAATREIIGINSNLLQIVRLQFTSGAATRLDVATQESQLAQASATLPPLLGQLAQQRDLLAALAGGFAGDGLAEKFEMSELQLPQELPLSLPSKLVEQRPDVRQAEENMHAASAQIGVAVANRLPNLTLTADAGTMALEAGQMFANGAGVWGLAGSVTQPIFQGGMLKHRERAARAAFDQAAAQYRSTVLTAFQNVADTLNALEQDHNSLLAAEASEAAAKKTLALTENQLATGTANWPAVLNAEQTLQQARLNLVQARASRLADTAALFVALGGGWWNPAPSDTTLAVKLK
jgi:NodT family efflux transporter outer membrane factor (OMF) lipoprotein